MLTVSDAISITAGVVMMLLAGEMHTAMQSTVIWSVGVALIVRVLW